MASETLPEVMRRLGVEPTKGRRGYLRKLMRRWQIDGTHLRPACLRHTERELRRAAAVSKSVAEVVRRLGLDPVGGNQAYIGRRLVQLDVETSHFAVAVRPREVRSERPLLSLGSAERGRIPGERLRRALVRAGVPETCAECGTGPVWNGKPLRLEVDHVNGDWWDNRRRNLRLLCPNCHAVTDTYRGRKRSPRAGTGVGRAGA
ncbi:HNH endonuclease [Streptomyces sp. Amel2xB2]|uniref:HNH endonuclease signature motif containing protein n=1 Tax=Streptomyces sp. Amel2xB2 TaxID=1305829 RepID=UPI000DBF65DC|nr:HNH endonuclease [Streptomyces sp. Amel2xB2]RAJ69737.1 HNH endonuclease [Streptomyces sp. Amel2xB2]